jgi:hypothetical protein
MAKKLTGLAEELKQLVVRCEVIDDFQPLANEFASCMEKHRVATSKLALHIERLRQAGAQGTSTEDFADDPTVQKSLRDITLHAAQIVRVTNRWLAVGASIGTLIGDITRLIAKAEDIVRVLPELKPVVAAAKELRAAVMELRSPDAIPQPRQD